MSADRTPAYLSLWESGELRRRATLGDQMLTYCEVCPRRCHVDRLGDIRGVCRTGRRAVVHSFAPHFGEEPPLVGRRGSGTIFIANCNLQCQYCQNYELSQFGHGREVDAAELASQMIQLQAMGCHNINLVSPSHVVPQILAALLLAVPDGLRLPLVYNTGGYDALPTLRLLDGIVDIYMPDMKYADTGIGERLSQCPDYASVSQQAVIEMHRQVGDLVTDKDGIAARGLLIRHLVLPEGLAGAPETARFIAEEISPNTYVNVMPQYRPAYRAGEFEELRRTPTRTEFQAALAAFRDAGLTRIGR